MDIKDLTDEMNRFVTSKGWYANQSARPQTPRNLAISLSLEAAEVLEHLQWSDNVTDKDKFQGELADVALYLLQLGSITGIDLETAVLQKLGTNFKREWDEKPENGEIK
ncbi:MAG: nucleotide pyrophosphohydrolase [Anaerolinea sp.]|nr:nucleotide pyrophosphohydrolase [Anaerolinea sp.]